MRSQSLTIFLPPILRPESDRGGWAFPLSLLLHAVVLGGVLLQMSPPSPPVTPPPAPMIELQTVFAEPPPPAPPTPPMVIRPPDPSPLVSNRTGAEAPAPKPRPKTAPPKEVTQPAIPAPPSDVAAPVSQETPAHPVPSAAPPQPSAPPASYIGQIRARLERLKRYPAEARYDGAEGTVQLRFVLDRSGALLSWSIEQGSGVAALDEEVGRMIRQAAPFPAFPDSLEQDRLELVIPVNFSLKIRVN